MAADHRPGPAAEVPAELRRDVRVLGDALGQVLRESGGEELLADVERLRRAVIDARRGDVEGSSVRPLVDAFDLERAELVARAFATFFQLANLAEERHRVRALRKDDRLGAGLTEDGDPRPGTLAEAVEQLTDEVGADTVREWLGRLRIHPVLTAHPTEMRRRAVIGALRRVRAQMERLDDPRAGAAQHADARRHLLEELTLLWRTAQLRRERPDVLDEVRTTLAVFDMTLFLVAPRLYRAVEAALAEPGVEPGMVPSPVPAFLRLGSWVGGDRDGNPHVTASVTRETVGIQADLVLRALHRAATRIGRTLTLDEALTPPSAALRTALDTDAAEHPDVVERLAATSPGAPHRLKVLLVAERLQATAARDADLGYRDARDLVADLRLVQESLAAAGAHRAAYGELQHLVWQAETFGLTLAGLEVRQDAAVHRSVIAEVLGEDHPAAGGGDPESDAAAGEALARLATEGWPEGAAPTSDTGREVLAALRTVAGLQARWGPRVCRRYVVSHTERPADLVAVRALARLAAGDRPLTLHVVPLLESVDDLDGGVELLDAWLALPGEREAEVGDGSPLEVMLGYSDSAKGAGPVRAQLTIYRAEERLVAWAQESGFELTLFHGRGGALGRGGGPAHRGILAQAPGSVAGRFKLTEQGEIVLARYGDLDIAERHLEQITAATLLAESPRRQAAAREAVSRVEPVVRTLEEAAGRAYAELVGADGFAEFVRRVTPLTELSELRVGSRPTSRPGAGGGKSGLDALRAIPWVSSWAQARINLPGWYGLGTGLEAAREEHGDEAVRDALTAHPLLQVLLENAAMSLAKTDEGIASAYLELGERPDLAERVLDERRRSVEQVLAVSGHERLLEERRVLAYAVELRNPYVDALSHLQLRALRALRTGEPEGEERDRLLRLVLLTAGGVAAGLQNTG